MRWLGLSLLIVAALVGCAPQPEPPTVTPAPVRTETPIVAPTQVTRQATTPPTLTPHPTPAGRANIRTVHLMPGLPAVDAYINGTAVAFGVEYTEATEPSEIDAVEGTLRLVTAGGRADDAPLLEAAVSLEPDANVVALLLPDGQVTYLNENVEPLASGTSRVRIVNAVEESQPTAFTVGGRALTSEPPLAYGEQSSEWKLPVGEYEVEAGDLIAPFTVALAAGEAQTVIVHGDVDAPQVTTFTAQVPQQVILQVLNLSEQIGPVDVYLNGNRALEALEVVARNGQLELPVDTYRVDFYQAGSDVGVVEPLLTGNVVMNPDDTVFAMLIGPAFDLRLVTFQADERPTRSDQTRITFVNAISETPRLEDVRNEDVQITLAYAQPTQVDLPAGRLDFEFVTDRTANDYTFVELVAVQEFEPGVNYLIPLLGERTDGRAERFMFEQAVGVEQVPVTPEPQPPQVYVINGTDRSVQVVLDGVLIESELVPGAASQAVELVAGRSPIAITEAATRASIFATERLFEQDGRYTLLVYGDVAASNFTVGQFDAGALPDASVLESVAVVRLVNGSLERERQLALAWAPIRQGQPPLSGTATAVAGTTPVADGVQLPAGTNRLSETAVENGAAGAWALLQPGLYDLYVYDVDRRDVLGVARGATLTNGAFYEVIVVPPGGGTADGVFIAPYPLDQ